MCIRDSDRTDWKAYILPLLFFKRISDVWDEEATEATEVYGESNPNLFPEIHRFVIPEGCHWRDVRSVAANVGTSLSRSMQEIELTNIFKNIISLFKTIIFNGVNTHTTISFLSIIGIIYIAV